MESKIANITNWVTKVVLNTKSTEAENKIPDTTGFITTPEFNRLTKISCDVEIKEAAKGLASRSQVHNGLDTADKSREKKLQTFDLSYFNSRTCFNNDG